MPIIYDGGPCPDPTISTANLPTRRSPRNHVSTYGAPYLRQQLPRDHSNQRKLKEDDFVQFIDTTDSLFGKFGRVTALRRNRVRIEVYRATIRPENIVLRTEQQLQFTESSDLFRIVPPGNGEDDWASERSIRDDDWNSVRSESSR